MSFLPVIRSIPRFVPVVLLTLHSLGNSQVPTDPAILQANVWDQSIILGPGAYRGTKVTSKQKAKHTILPGTLIEKMNFTADGEVRWQIEGALLRETRFSGDLGTQLEAKDTGFEECFFTKSGGWFVGWAGTRWRFENCVFTRSFMPANSGVHDHSVRAVGCTFVGIKMPAFGLKKNPAQGVQGKDLQFVRCRFVGCEIPETSLALTVDCAFENCQFIPKKHDWEKAEGPVTVTAYVATGRVPPSYVNGKLTVTFKQGQPLQAAGATLPHTLAGPRIIMPWAQQFQAFTVLGSQEKPASAIPAFAKAADKPTAAALTPPVASPPLAIPPTPQPPPANRPTIGRNSFFNLPETNPPVPLVPQPIAPAAAVTRVAPAAPPAAREIRSLDELLVVVPLDQEFLTQGRVNPAALDLVNLKLDQAWAGKPAAFRITVDEVVAHRADGYAFKILGQITPLTLRGQAITARVEALFRQDESSRLSRAQKSSVIQLRGILSKAELTSSGRAIKLTVMVADSKLQ